MDLAKLVIELREERDQIDEVLSRLERLLKNRGRGRDLPPAGTAAIVAPRRGRPVGSRNKTPTRADGIIAVA